MRGHAVDEDADRLVGLGRAGGLGGGSLQLVVNDELAIAVVAVDSPDEVRSVRHGHNSERSIERPVTNVVGCPRFSGEGAKRLSTPTGIVTDAAFGLT